MTHQFHIRLAGSRDVNKIATLSRDLIETGLDWSWHPRRVGRAVRDKDTIAAVACVGQALAGFAIVRVGFVEANLDLLAVRPGRRRQGIGRTLVQWVEQSVLVAGVGIIRVQVRSDRPAVQTFYLALGYEPWATAPGYYANGRDAVYMAHDLWCRPVTDEVR